MTRNPNVYLDDIRESIGKIEEYIQGVSRSEFISDTGIQDKVIRRLEIIGEAVKHLPKAQKTLHPKVPWKLIAGMRDILIHDYANVNVERVWTVVVRDIPLLKKHIQ